MSLYLSAVCIQIDGEKRYVIGESGIFLSACNTPAEAYRYGVTNYGRCISSIYIDRQDACDLLEGRPARTVPIGWAFVKRTKKAYHLSEKYEDNYDTYLQETWLAIEEGPSHAD